MFNYSFINNPHSKKAEDRILLLYLNLTRLPSKVALTLYARKWSLTRINLNRQTSKPRTANMNTSWCCGVRCALAFFFGGGVWEVGQREFYFFERQSENIRSLFDYSWDRVRLIPLRWKWRYSYYSRHNAIEALNREAKRENSLKGAHLESRNISLFSASP